VPFLGPIAGAVPALAAALPSSGLTIIMTVVAVIVIQQAVGGLIAPKMLGDSARVSPAWGVLAVMVGVSLFGLLGLIAAIPVLIAVKAAFKVIVKNNLAHNVHNV
jgi:predicted PurR-regulated permease PerM